MAATAQDRILLAQLTGTATRHARLSAPTQAQHHAAIIELADIALGRADLLAECAGLTAGYHQGHPDEARHLRAAQLCIDAGADTSLIPRWVEEGSRRAIAARAGRTRSLPPVSLLVRSASAASAAGLAPLGAG